MKKIILNLTGIVALLFISCDTESTANLSSITNYAVINIIGDTEVIINQGDNWTDPGADVVLAGAAFPYETSLVVDTNTAGVYYIDYSAINDEGFAANARRTVVVVSTAASIYNLEGSWARSNGSPGICTQISDRYYTYDNAGGVAGENQLTITFINVNDDEIYIPFKADASPSGLSVSSFAPGEIQDNDNWSWSLNASGFYGTFTRTFSRQ
ncbi:MAG: immunoglobulin-like domain-containing protein [Algibacter sp.]